MVRRFGLCVATFLVISRFAAAEDMEKDRWTVQDTIVELAFLGVWEVDRRQTLEIADNPKKYYEKNRVLGRHPTRQQVNTYFLLGGALHAAIAYYLPRDAKIPFWGLTFGHELAAVVRNRAIGLSVQMRF